MFGKTDSYALLEVVRPLETEQRGEGDDAYTVYAFIVRERGNKKLMSSARKRNGKGWVVSLTDTPVGGKMYLSAALVPLDLLR